MIMLIFILGLGLIANACWNGQPGEPQREASEARTAATKDRTKPLSEIDLAKLGRIAPKGRVQDKAYNELEIIDQLIANGKDAIPFLIRKLDDGTVIQHHVIDYWPGDITVGDVAFVILSNFATDSSWTRNTIPGTDRDSLLGKYDPDLPGVERLSRFVEKRGRKPIKRKWENIWGKYKDRIVWDEQERCFKVA